MANIPSGILNELTALIPGVAKKLVSSVKNTHAPKSFSIDAFKSSVASDGGFTRGYLFACSILPQSMALSWDRSMTVLCRAATLPAETIETTELFYHTRPVRIPGRRTYPPITLSFFSTANYSVRSFFESWMMALNDPDENRRLLNHDNAIYADITLDHFDIGHTGTVNHLLDLFAANVPNGSLVNLFRGGNSKLATYTLMNAFPTSISAPVFAYDNEEIQTFDVELTYQSMRLETAD